MHYKFYTSQEHHNFILERLKNKITTHKSRYKMDLYLMNGDYFYTFGVNIAKEFLIAEKMQVDINYDDDGLYIIWKPTSNNKTKVRFMFVDS